MRKSIISIFIMGILLASVLGIGYVAAEPVEKIPVIVGFKGKPDAALVRSHGGDIKYEYKIIRAIACSLPEKAIDALKKNPNVAYIEEDGIVQLIPVKAPEETPWGITQIDADIVHAYNKGAGVKVAIIDTGIDVNHPDLDFNYKGGYDYIGGDDVPDDEYGHGTHVAGIIAALDNDIGVIGVAPKAQLYAVKTFDASGSGTVSDIVAGIEWSVYGPDREPNTGDELGIQVISMSFGSNRDYSSMRDACDAAYTEGLLLVASAGNDYRGYGRWEFDTVDYPAKYDSVIAVGATDKNNVKASWSSTGSALELAAPGVDIYSTLPTYEVTMTANYGLNYGTVSGTSMACPHVTGTVALVMAAYPTWSNVEVRTQLQDTADDLGALGPDTWYGYGLVDADEAAAPTDTPPTVNVVSPIDGDTVAGNVTIQVNASDDVSIESVKYCIDSGSYTAMTYNSATGYYEASWDTTQETDDLHAVSAQATDTIGQKSTDSITVAVDNIDNAPTVKLTSPAEGAMLSGSITIEASASDDKGIDRVEFYVDGTLIGTDRVSPYSCSWDTTTVADDSHIIKAVTIDTIGQGAADQVSVTVDNTPPVVAIINPSSGATVSETVTIQASVTDYYLLKVEYCIDSGNLLAMTFNSATGYWEASWDTMTVANGAHTITVRAEDEAGNICTDESTVTVDNLVPANVMHVQSIDMNLVSRWRGWRVYATATVTVVDADGNLVEGATLYGHWEGATTDSDSGVTDSAGQVTLQSDRLWRAQSGTTFTFVVDDIIKDGWTYDPSANVETSDSVTVP